MPAHGEPAGYTRATKGDHRRRPLRKTGSPGQEWLGLPGLAGQTRRRLLATSPRVPPNKLGV
eukprot:6261223-Pyramimonas_sp.AAC.1